VFYNILEDCKKRSTSIDNLSMIGTTSNSLVHNKQSQGIYIHTSIDMLILYAIYLCIYMNE
jgi:hypothetical protein